MLYNEFKTLQDQIVDILVDYTIFLKKGAQLDYRYTYEFKDEILKDFKYRNENTLLVTAGTMLTDKKSLDEVDSYISNYKKNYERDINGLNRKIVDSELVVKNEINDEMKKELENHFIDLVRNYYPAIRLEANEEYIKAFELLHTLYQQNNYTSYFATYDLFKNLFTYKDYHDVDFEKYVNIYMNLMQRINSDTVKRKQGYPYTKEEVFEDEITIAREKGEFRAKLTKLIEANKAIKEDFKAIYGEVVEL